MTGLDEGALSQDVLRSAVAQLRRREPRRRFPTTLRAGSPGHEDDDFEDAREVRLDQALRTEVVAALLSRALKHSPHPPLWLRRGGAPTTEDIDLQWYAAARAAYGEAGVALAMVVVTRTGWYDPYSAAHREWKRLRVRT